MALMAKAGNINIWRNGNRNNGSVNGNGEIYQWRI